MTKYLKRISTFLMRQLRRLSDRSRSIEHSWGRITLKSRLFDEVDYERRVPEAVNYPHGSLSHFFNVGLDQGQRARFFDPQFYNDAYSDVAASSYDAKSHFTGEQGDRSRLAKFFEIGASFDRQTSPSYQTWVQNYDQKGCEEHEHIVSTMGVSNSAETLCFCCDFSATQFDMERYPAFFRSLREQYDQGFVTYLLVRQDDVTAARTSLSDGYPDLKIIVLDTGQCRSEWHFLTQVSAEFVGKTIVRLEPSVVVSPTFCFWLKRTSRTENTTYLIFSDHDYLSKRGLRQDPQFKPEFNYDLLLNYNYMGCVWAIDRCALCKVLQVGDEYCSDISYEIILSYYDSIPSPCIMHLEKIGYSKALPQQTELDKGAIVRHLTRVGDSAKVLNSAFVPNCARISYELPALLPLVSIIIPTRDKVDFLKTCITSIREFSTYKKYEIIIVDNGSVEKPSLDYLSEIGELKNCKVVRVDEAFNYSKLNNIGAKIASGDYLCFLNNDVEVISPNWIEELLQFSIQDDVAIVGAKLYYPNDTVQHAGVLLGHTGFTGHWHKHIKRTDHGYMNRASLQQSVGAVTGAAMMISADKFGLLGKFDENLPVSFNDIDLCLKALSHGYRNVFNPCAELYHFESVSRGLDDTIDKRALADEEAAYVRKKHKVIFESTLFYNKNLSPLSENFALAFPPENILKDGCE